MKPPKRLFKSRDPGPETTEPTPLEWPPVEHGQRVDFSDGIGGVVLMLEPGMCIIQREDGRSFCARRESDDTIQFSWGATQEPYASVRSMVRMLYAFWTQQRGVPAGMATHKVKEAIRGALDRQDCETGNANIDGRTEVVLSSAGVIRMAVARDGFDCRDPHQQEAVFAEAARVLGELSSGA